MIYVIGPKVGLTKWKDAVISGSDQYLNISTGTSCFELAFAYLPGSEKLGLGLLQIGTIYHDYKSQEFCYKTAHVLKIDDYYKSVCNIAMVKLRQSSF